MMNTLWNTALGRLKLLGWLEGSSLVVLVLIALPLKYLFGNPSMIRVLGSLHGILFLLFIFQTLNAGIEQKWQFRKTTWKVLLACLVPFGIVYINSRILNTTKNQTSL